MALWGGRDCAYCGDGLILYSGLHFDSILSKLEQSLEHRDRHREHGALTILYAIREAHRRYP